MASTIDEMMDMRIDLVLRNEIFRIVSHDLSPQDWKEFCRHLHLRDSEIDDIEAENSIKSSGFPEIRFQALLKWAKTMPDRVTVNVIKSALQACERNDIVEKVDKAAVAYFQCNLSGTVQPDAVRRPVQQLPRDNYRVVENWAPQGKPTRPTSDQVDDSTDSGLKSHQYKTSDAGNSLENSKVNDEIEQDESKNDSEKTTKAEGTIGCFCNNPPDDDDNCNLCTCCCMGNFHWFKRN